MLFPHEADGLQVGISTAMMDITMESTQGQGKQVFELPLLTKACCLLTGVFTDTDHSLESPLETLGLRIHSELKILICLTCRHALNPETKAVIKHFNSNHCEKGQTTEKIYPKLSDRLQQTLKGFVFALPKEVRQQPPD